MLCFASGEKREKSTVMYFALLSNLSISKWHSPLWGCDFSSSCSDVKIMMSGLFVCFFFS